MANEFITRNGFVSLDNSRITGSLNVSGNTTIGGTLEVTGVATLTNLTGTGTRMVVANTSGVLSTQVITVGTVTNVTATSPLFSSGGATPNITIQQANSSQNGFLSSTDWNTFNGKQNALSGTGFVKISGTTISYDNSTYLTSAVTSVSGTGTVSGLTLSGTVTSSGNLTLGGTLSVTPSNFSSQTANTFLAAPNGASGTPTFRAIVAADIPTLNQNTTGNAATATNSTQWNGFNFNTSTAISSGVNFILATDGSSSVRVANATALQSFIGLSSSNWVDLTTTQTVGGAKTFSSLIQANANITVGAAGVGGGGANKIVLNYENSASSRSWQIINDQTVFGDFAIQQSTTQTGSTFSNALYFDASKNATFSGNTTIAGTLGVTGAAVFNTSTSTNPLAGFADVMIGSGSGDKGLFINSGNSSFSRLYLGNNSLSSISYIRQDNSNGNFEIGNGGSTRLTIASSGAITASGSIAATHGLFSVGTYSTNGNALISSNSTIGPHIVGNTDASGNSTIGAAAMRVQFGGGGFIVSSSPSTTAGSARTFTDRFTVATNGSITASGDIAASGFQANSYKTSTGYTSISLNSTTADITLNYALNVNGNTNLGGTLGVTGAATFSNNLLVDNGTGGGRLTLENGATRNTIYSTTTGFGSYNQLRLQANSWSFHNGTSEVASISSGGNTTIGGTLGVTGALTGTTATFTTSTNGEQAFNNNNSNSGTSAISIYNLNSDASVGQLVYTSSTYAGAYTSLGANTYALINRSASGGGIKFITGGFTDAQTRLAISTSGAITASSNLSVGGTLGVTGVATFSNTITATQATLNNNGDISLKFNPNGTAKWDLYYNNADGSIGFYDRVGSAFRMTIAQAGAITASGKLGINGAAASYGLTVYNSSNGTTAAIGGTAFGLRVDNGGSFGNGGTVLHGVDNSFFGSYQKLSLNGSSLEFMTDYGTKLTIANGGAITASSNLSVGGTLTLGTAGGAAINAGGNYLLTSSTTYTQIWRRDNSVGIYLGGSSDQNNYYDNNGHIFRNASGVNQGTINNVGQMSLWATSGTDHYLNFYRAGYENWYVGTRSNTTQFSIWSGTTAGTNIMTMGNGGNTIFNYDVTITSPTTTGKLLIGGSQGGARLYMIENGITGISNTGFQIRDMSSGITPLYISSSNDVVVNYDFYSRIITASSYFKGEIYSSNLQAGINFPSNNTIAFRAGNVDNRLVLASTGNVLIGTTVDSGFKLLVNGTTYTGGFSPNATAYQGNVTMNTGTTYVYNAGSGSHTFTLQSASGSNQIFIVKNHSTRSLTIATTGGDVIIDNAGASTSTFTLAANKAMIIQQDGGSTNYIISIY